MTKLNKEQVARMLAEAGREWISLRAIDLLPFDGDSDDDDEFEAHMDMVLEVAREAAEILYNKEVNGVDVPKIDAKHFPTYLALADLVFGPQVEPVIKEAAIIKFPN